MANLILHTIFVLAVVSGIIARRPLEQTDAERSIVRHNPNNPSNHSIYTVRGGDTLTSIAAQRKGVTVDDLAWLNGIRIDAPLRIGQPIKLPHQSFLDAGREAKNRYLALELYMKMHGGALPPN